VPSGAATLLAACALLAAGFGEWAGLPRGVAVAWAVVTAAASALNLPLPGGGPEAALLWNPGGCVFPGAFAAFLLCQAPRRGAPAAVRRACLLAAVAGAILAAGPAWGAQAGRAGLGAALAAAAEVAAAWLLTPDAPHALAGCAGAMAVAAVLRGLAGAVGLAGWPASLGGGETFDAGVLAALGAQALLPLGAALPRRLRRVWRALRTAELLRVSLR
jgi:hypothetical protein